MCGIHASTALDGNVRTVLVFLLIVQRPLYLRQELSIAYLRTKGKQCAVWEKNSVNHLELNG